MSDPGLLAPHLPESGAELSALRQHLSDRDARIELLNELINRLGHDFKNLLVPQLGYVTLIKEEVGDGSPVMPFISKLQEANERTEQFLDKVLCAVRPRRKFSARPGNLNLVIEDEVRRWKSTLPSAESISVQLELIESPWQFDESHWRRVIAELLCNAQWALAGGGELRIRLFQRELNSAQREALGIDRPAVYQIDFQDAGIGMDANVAARAFEPWFSTRSKALGAGLGLTMVHGVTRLHGGQLLLTSVPTIGTTVTIWLPS